MRNRVSARSVEPMRVRKDRTWGRWQRAYRLLANRRQARLPQIALANERITVGSTTLYPTSVHTCFRGLSAWAGIVTMGVRFGWDADDDRAAYKTKLIGPAPGDCKVEGPHRRVLLNANTLRQVPLKMSH